MTTDLSFSERAFRPTWRSSLFGLAIDAALILDATRRLASGSDPYAYVEIAFFVLGAAAFVPRLFGWQEVHLDFEGFATKTPWRWPWTKKDRKSTRLNSSHTVISYAVFCLKKKKQKIYAIFRF